MIIAIDGPAGAGKSTVAKKVAEKLDFLYIDTGAMYRAVTWLVLTNKLSLKDSIDWHQLIAEHPIELRPDVDGYRVFVGNQDVTEDIRTPEVTSLVPQIAGIPEVRRELVQLQRRMAEHHDVVMDGRDIGTHVFPQAELKIFLTASIEERARRRYHDLLEKGYHPQIDELRDEIALRDKQDQERDIAPLKKDDQAELIDTTGLSIQEVVDRIISIFRKKVRTS